MTFRIATTQPTADADVRRNGARARELMRSAAASRAMSPHNSLYVIADSGRVVDRYDKRICSNRDHRRSTTTGSLSVPAQSATWRASARLGDVYRTRHVDDPRSGDHACV